MNNFFSLHDVHKSYTQGAAEIAVISHGVATFKQGSSYAITGVSGSGKSTLLHLIAGIEDPTSGWITYNEQKLQTMTPGQKSDFFNRSIGVVFQSPYLIKELSVLENVMLKGLIAGRPHADCIHEAHQLLDEVQLRDKSTAYPAHLSGGQAQRVALARALMNRPAFLLADEPTGNLDIDTGKVVLDFIVKVAKEWKMGLIISSHDRYVTSKMDEILIVSHGHLNKEVKA